jgi:hypothetical protein
VDLQDVGMLQHAGTLQIVQTGTTLIGYMREGKKIKGVPYIIYTFCCIPRKMLLVLSSFSNGVTLSPFWIGQLPHMKRRISRAQGKGLQFWIQRVGTEARADRIHTNG